MGDATDDLWEVSVLEIKQGPLVKYKVTRRIAHLNIAETRIVDSKEQVKEQIDAWLR